MAPTDRSVDSGEASLKGEFVDGNAVGQVDYDILDRVKQRCIEAARETLDFAQPFGRVTSAHLGASANVFKLDLSSFGPDSVSELVCSLIPEGLGTADDARPADLTPAEATEFWFNIGVKTIATMTNDAASAALRPLLVGLYLPTSTPESVFTEPFLGGFLPGVVAACREVGCVYLSGETPQLKSKLLPNTIDIAGSVWALQPNQNFVPAGVSVGDQIVLIASSGIHENGFTPFRKLTASLPEGFRHKIPLSEARGELVELWRVANQASKLYSPLVQQLLSAGVRPTALENITGHGWLKIMRSAQPLLYRIHTVLPLLGLFEFVEDRLALSRTELLKIFNCGAGFCLFLRSREEAEQAVKTANELGYSAVVAGQVEPATQRELIVEPWGVTLSGRDFGLSR